MKHAEEATFTFEQRQFLRGIDPTVKAGAANEFTKAKTRFYRQQTRELKQQQVVWDRHAALLGETNPIDRKKAERSYRSS